jgi:hypothetical protein
MQKQVANAKKKHHYAIELARRHHDLGLSPVMTASEAAEAAPGRFSLY